MPRRTHDGVEFELPIEIEDRVARRRGVIRYVCRDSESRLVQISELTSPKRDPGVTWFQLDRMSAILDGFEQGLCVPPIEIHRHPQTMQVLVRDGLHRYYLAVAAGLTEVPCREYKYFNIRDA